MTKFKSKSNSFSKIFIGVLLLLLAGCDSSTPTIEPTPEKMPWLFPEPQIELLSENDSRARGLALKNLADMGAKAEIAIPAIEKLLEKEKDPKIRALAEKALTQIRESLGEGG